MNSLYSDTRGNRSLVVTGRPGIGSSLSIRHYRRRSRVLSLGISAFLLRVLLRRLAFRLPIALQISSNCALLFNGGGVKECIHSVQPEPDGEAIGRSWALVDSDRRLLEPTRTFQAGPFFIVEASFPCCYVAAGSRKSRPKHSIRSHGPLQKCSKCGSTTQLTP